MNLVATWWKDNSLPALDDLKELGVSRQKSQYKTIEHCIRAASQNPGFSTAFELNSPPSINIRERALMSNQLPDKPSASLKSVSDVNYQNHSKWHTLV